MKKLIKNEDCKSKIIYSYDLINHSYKNSIYTPFINSPILIDRIINKAVKMVNKEKIYYKKEYRQKYKNINNRLFLRYFKYSMLSKKQKLNYKVDLNRIFDNGIFSIKDLKIKCIQVLKLANNKYRFKSNSYINGIAFNRDFKTTDDLYKFLISLIDNSFISNDTKISFNNFCNHKYGIYLKDVTDLKNRKFSSFHSFKYANSKNFYYSKVEQEVLNNLFWQDYKDTFKNNDLSENYRKYQKISKNEFNKNIKNLLISRLDEYKNLKNCRIVNNTVNGKIYYKDRAGFYYTRKDLILLDSLLKNN